MKSDMPLVVGIGASAGGIAALEGFFRNLPDDIGMTFLIATHLSPDRKSLLHEVIGRYTAIPVYVAKDAADLQPNTVHIMPEGKTMTVHGRRLRLADDDPVHRERKPIDVLFASMPEVHSPERKGFGLVLIEGQIRSQLRGEVESKFPPEGFILDLSFPLST